MSALNLFPPLRPRRKPSKTNKLKRPASRELQMNLKRQLSRARHEMIGVRGSVCNPDKESPRPLMPAQIADATRDPSHGVPGFCASCMAAGTRETKESQHQSQEEALKELEATLGEVGDSRCSSPSGSTIIDLDSLLDSSDSEISPLSEQNSLRSASRLARFFPELSSHFAVVSPVSADRASKEMGPTLFERELEERVQILYRNSADVDPEEPRQTGIRSFFGSDGFDGASSCYSRRTSITTLGTEFWGDDGKHPYKSADAYSIYSPAAAGVFDDVASLSRRPSTVPPYTLHVPDQQQGPAKQTSMFDLKNKPLPLEPGCDNDSTPRCHGDSLSSTVSPRTRPQWSTDPYSDLIVSPLQPAAPISHRDWKVSMSQKLNSNRQGGHVWHGSEHNEIQPQPRRGRQEGELQINAPRIGQGPTLSQATKELEGTLAYLSGADIPRKALSILDGPLQISRNNGDLVATRRAPVPPTRSSPNKNKNARSVESSPSPTKGPSRKFTQKIKARDRETDEKPPKSNRSSTDSDKKDKKKSFLAPFRKQSQVRISAQSECQSHMTSDLHFDPNRPELPAEDLATAELLERVVEHVLSGSPGGPNPAQSQHKEVRSKMRQSWALVSTAQASSLQLTDQIYELPAEPSSPRVLPPVKSKSNDKTIPLPTDMPLDLIISIISHIDSLDDLFNFVLVNKKVYSAFKRRELPLIKNALFKMSPPAWELREMSPPWEMEWQPLIDPDSQVPEYTPTLYLQRYAQDIYTLAKLKALVLARCAPFLRRETVRGLAGIDNERAEAVDDAFWRLWTFCRIFGSGKRRENDIAGQMDWLRGGHQAKTHSGSASTVTQPFGINNVLFEPPKGFGRGNLTGLSRKQMYDMTEIWTCMGVLLQPMHGKCIEARKVGIFDNLHVPEGDPVREEIVLEEWTSYILTLGLDAILTLSSVCAADTTSAKFVKAQSIGLTKWEITETEASRSSFLKEAVSRAYELRERESSPAKPRPHRGTNPASASRERQTALANELRSRRARGLEEPEGRLSFSAERPMSEYSTILRNLDPTAEPPVPPLPAMLVDRSSTSTSGTAPHTPIASDPSSFDSGFAARSPLPSHKPRSPPTLFVRPPPRPQVLDPVDRAIHMMVNELGFATEDAKWALKITDTGEGIDAPAAIQLLQKQKKKNDRNPFGKRDSLLSSVIKRQKSHDSGWRWA